MDMRVLKSEMKLCTCCMEEHEVKTVLVDEETIFKNIRVPFEATYMFCDLADEFYVNEEQLQDNDTKMKDSYRRNEGLLTSGEISTIRSKYGISQADLCTLLGWGGKTITRYESHQVQDKAHDTILRKIDQDPAWFLDLLADARLRLSEDAYQKYEKTAISLYEASQDSYLRKTIAANYMKFQGRRQLHGNTELSLDKVVDVIRYFASSDKVSSLYKNKLMRLMWYADALSYKRRGRAITGLVYQALPMGTVPIGQDFIIDLKGVPCEEVEINFATAYQFSCPEEHSFPTLSGEETTIIDDVIEKLGRMSREELVEFMHKERAYTETKQREEISFSYTDSLQVS